MLGTTLFEINLNLTDQNSSFWTLDFEILVPVRVSEIHIESVASGINSAKWLTVVLVGFKHNTVAQQYLLSLNFA